MAEGAPETAGTEVSTIAALCMTTRSRMIDGADMGAMMTPMAALIAMVSQTSKLMLAKALPKAEVRMANLVRVVVPESASMTIPHTWTMRPTLLERGPI